MEYERDLIAERDRWQRMKNTVIKWWQVNYVEDSAVLEDNSGVGNGASGQILDGDYNETTGSYSGSYGRVVTLDQGGMDQVASILNEKGDAIQQMFKDASSK